MKTIHIILTSILTICLSCTEEEQSSTLDRSSWPIGRNQDKFGFLVLDAAKVDTFMQSYQPLIISNPDIGVGLREKLVDLRFNQKELDSLDQRVKRFHMHTLKPNKVDFDLAKTVINASLKPTGEEYFDGSLQYLFYHDCLPSEFAYKWYQLMHRFQFGLGFFNEFRRRSKEFDDLMYGHIEFQDDVLLPILGDHLYFNEITPQVARKLQQTILDNPVFKARDMKQDRANFLFFLNQVITGKWRLIILDFH